MTVTNVATLEQHRSLSADPRLLTLSFSNITAPKCVLVVRAGSFNSAETLSHTVSWQAGDLGGPDVDVGAANAANALIWVEVLGNLNNESGDVVFDCSGDAFTAMGCSATIYSGVDQVAAIRDTDTYFVTGSFNNAQNDLAGLLAGDMTTDFLMCVEAFAAATPGPGQNEIHDQAHSFAGIDNAHSAASEIIATGTTQQVTYTTTSSSGRGYVAVALAAAVPGVAIMSVTGSQGAGEKILPSDTNVDVQHSGADAPGTTRMFLGDSADFNTATLTEQTISAITVSDLNWDSVSLGALQTGPLFLFIQTDSGGPAQEESVGFPLIVSEREILTGARLYKCTGLESGPTIVTSDLPFVPHGSIIRVNSATVRDVFNPQWITTVCIVDDVTAMGECSASQDSPRIVKRSQASGSNSLIVLDPTSNGAADYITGTPSLTDTGMVVDFSATTAGLELLLLFFGGDTLEAEAREIQISDGSVTGLNLTPEMVFGSTTGQTQGSPGDTSFSRMSMGWAKGAASDEQVSIHADVDGSDRNCQITGGVFLKQLSGTGTTWDMDITAFTSDGITWSGSNSDSAYLLFLNLDGAQTFLDLFAKEAGGVDGFIEDLPDTGIDNLGWLWQMNVARLNESTSPAFGARMDTGLVGIDGQHSELVVHNPSTGSGTSESRLSFGKFVENTSGQTTISIEGVITKFARTPEIQWNINTPNALLFGLVGWESLGDITGERGVEASMLGALGVSG